MDASTSLNARILSTFLNELDGVQGMNESSNILVIVACQDIHRLDDALIRTGRLQHHIELHLPTRYDILSMLRRKLYVKRDSPTNPSLDDDLESIEKKIPCSLDVDIEILADMIMTSHDHPTCSSVDSICHNATMNAIRECMTSGDYTKTAMLSMKHFQQCLAVN